MSVKYRRGLCIEELFSHLKQNVEEYRTYNLYMSEDGDIEAISFPQEKNSLMILKNR